jgi:hypothetical protein
MTRAAKAEECAANGELEDAHALYAIALSLDRGNTGRPRYVPASPGGSAGGGVGAELWI